MDETLSSSRFGPAPFTGRPGAVAFARTSAARAASDSAALFWASAICKAVGRINQATIRHNLLVQDLTLRSMKSGAISGYLTEREITVGGERGVKRPDVVWLPKTGGRIAVEVELTATWARHFDKFVSGILTALNPPSGHPSYDKFCVITESPAIFNRYSQGMAADQPLNTWKKDSSGLWKIVKKGTVPDWLSERVSFRLVKST